MTLIQELVDAASGDQVPVATLLRKVKVIASRLETGELEAWVEHELVGYPDEAALPEYRGPFSTEVQGHFGGPFGSGMQNAPIPAMGFPESFRDGQLFSIEFRQSVAELTRLAGAESSLRADWPADAVAYTNALLQRGEVNLYEGMGLQQAWRRVSPTQLEAIVDTVRTRILDLALSLERVDPSAGEPGSSVPESEVKTIVTNVYGGSPNIAVASTGVEQNVVLPRQGDEAALIALLSELGVPAAEIDELRVALREDEADGASATDSPGPRVTSWIGRVWTWSASAGGHVGTAAAGNLIAQAIAAYLGIG